MAGRQVFGPDNIGNLTKVNSTTVQLAASAVTLGGLQYDTGTLQILTVTSGAGGIDVGSVAANSIYYVYVVLNAGVEALTASLDTSAPTGFAVYKKVGAFTTNSSTNVSVVGKSIIKEADSMVRLHTGNGHGSTDTNIRRFSNIVESIGDAITYIDSITAGASFIIQKSGIYNISYTDRSVASTYNFGISKNSTQLTLSIASIDADDRLSTNSAAGANAVDTTTSSWSGYLNEGDIIRPHTSANNFGNVATVQFTISKISTVTDIG